MDCVQDVSASARKFLIVIACLVWTLSNATYAQRLMHQLAGLNGDDGFGKELIAIGDVDGDGVDDFAVGAPTARVGMLAQAGYVGVFSGKTQTELYRISGTRAGMQLGCVLKSVGDVNADGIRDFAIGVPYDSTIGDRQGSVRVHSGVNGFLIHHWDGSNPLDGFGEGLDGLGDVDGDGADDIIVGAPGFGPWWWVGAFYVYSGMSGSVIASQTSPITGARFGSEVTSAGDFDSDGIVDYFVSAPSNGTNTFLGVAWIFSGANPALILRTFAGSSPDDFFGHVLLLVGDIDGDGLEDLAISAPTGLIPGGVRNGYVRFFAGGSGSLLFTINGSGSFANLGRVLARTADFDRDGVDDTWIGSASSNGIASASLISTRLGTSIMSIRGSGSTLALGSSIDGTGDFDGDGTVDVLIGAPSLRFTPVPNLGAVRVYALTDSGLLASPSSLSSAVGGTQLLTVNPGTNYAGSPYLVLKQASEGRQIAMAFPARR